MALISEKVWEYSVGSDNWSPLTQTWQVDLSKPCAARAKIHLGWYYEKDLSSSGFLVGIMGITRKAPDGTIKAESFGGMNSNLFWRLSYYDDSLTGVSFAAYTTRCFGKIMFEIGFWQKLIKINKNALQITSADDEPDLAPAGAVALYDPKTGTIAHLHHTISSPKAKKASPELLQNAARKNAELLGQRVSKLKCLYIPKLSRMSSFYRVDLKKKKVIGTSVPEVVIDGKEQMNDELPF